MECTTDLDLTCLTALVAPVSIVVPDFTPVRGTTPDDEPELFMYLTGFAVLTVAYPPGRFTFAETVRVSEDYNHSVRLLAQLTDAIPSGSKLGALNVHKLVSALVRVPRGEPDDRQARASLDRLVEVLEEVPEDLSDYDHETGRAILDSIGTAHDLEPDWASPHRERNPIANGRRLSARAQTLFLAMIGKHCPDLAIRTAASADLQAWRASGHSIA